VSSGGAGSESPSAYAPTLVLMAGLPGSGKSTLAVALGRRLGWPVLDKDTIKSGLLGIGVGEDLAGPASYVRLYELSRDLVLGQRLSVILDSPAAYPQVIERTGKTCLEAGARLKVVLCLAERATRNRRMQERTPMPSQPAISARRGDNLARDGFALAGRGRERFVHLPEATMALDTERPVGGLVEEAMAYVLDGSR
jgi:predicted kinase